MPPKLKLIKPTKTPEQQVLKKFVQVLDEIQDKLEHGMLALDVARLDTPQIADKYAVVQAHLRELRALSLDKAWEENAITWERE